MDRLTNVPTRVGFHHVSIAVTDLEKAVDFWTRLFGLEVLSRFSIAKIQGDAAFVGNDNFQIELWRLEETAPVPKERRKPNEDLLTAGTKHIALRVPELHKVVSWLAQNNVRIVAVQRRLGEPMIDADTLDLETIGDTPIFAVFIHDPFGTLVELWDEHSSQG